MDRGLNELLKWSIENTKETGNREDSSAPTPAATGAARAPLNQEALAAFFGGGPSDADLMRAAMDVVTSRDDPDISLETKLVAFDNFEQLIESLDNANNLAALSLWTPLLSMLESEEAELRRMAAWCVGTAVQNNEPSQERLLAVGGVPRLVALATNSEETEPVRKKAIYALSSACRNYQPAMDVCTEELGKLGRSSTKVDALNMNAVDVVMDGLKAELSKK